MYWMGGYATDFVTAYGITGKRENENGKTSLDLVLTLAISFFVAEAV
jgi:hypothetical protein